MSTVGRLVYLGVDPYGGAVGLLGDTAHTARVPVQVHGPREDSVGILVSALHVACYLQRNPTAQSYKCTGAGAQTLSKSPSASWSQEPPRRHEPGPN
jgi:hypothetical protein